MSDVPETANTTSRVLINHVWHLPPLILHPFASQAGPGKLLEGSKAALTLAGLVSSENTTREDLLRKLIEGRYCEVRMLYFVGKDLRRWVGQCVDMAGRAPELASFGLKEASFAQLLVEDPPAVVHEKLQVWGVSDHKQVFSRALGLNAVFRKAPSAEDLSDHFLRNYYRYADHLFACSQNLQPFTEIHSSQFHFELYASGEFTRMLQDQWATD